MYGVEQEIIDNIKGNTSTYKYNDPIDVSYINKLLQTNNLNINFKEMYTQKTILMYACEYGNINLVKNILKYKPNLYHAIGGSGDILTSAMFRGNIIMALYIINEMSFDINNNYLANVLRAYCNCNRCNFYIVIAIKYKLETIVKALLQKGIKIRDDLLDIACESDDFDIIKLLIEKNKKILINNTTILDKYFQNINYNNSKKIDEQLKNVYYLLQNGVHICDSTFGKILNFKNIFSNVETEKLHQYFIINGHININKQSENNLTFILYAIKNKLSINHIDFLLSGGAKVYMCDVKGNNSFHTIFYNNRKNSEYYDFVQLYNLLKKYDLRMCDSENELNVDGHNMIDLCIINITHMNYNIKNINEFFNLINCLKCPYNKKNIVNTLCEILINIKENNHFVCYNTLHTFLIQLLEKNIIDLNDTDCMNKSLIIYCINTPLMKIFINNKSNTYLNMNEPDINKNTVLHHMAKFNHSLNRANNHNVKECRLCNHIHFILRHKFIDINKKNIKHETPYFLAIKYGNTIFAKYLLKYGAYKY